jgi:penicillin-binding protein 1A
VAAASRAYFGKDVRTIGIPEAAYLAGLIRAPEAADAQNDPTEASRRRKTALVAMREEGMISEAEEQAADATPWEGHLVARRDRTKLDIDPGLEAIGGAYFIEEVRQQIAEKYGDGVLYGGGLRIYVSLDREMQEDAWNAVTSVLNQPDDPAAALVAVDDQGRVKAMVGGKDFEAQKVNYAMGAAGGGSGRQAGSSFKPFTLAAAVRQGISLNSKFNAPAEIILPKANAGKDWKVGNYGDAEQGVLDLVDATRVSSNTAFAQLMLEVGPENVVDLAHRMGVASDLSAVNSLTLGTSEVSPLDMAVGFSTLANRGVHNAPDFITRIEQVEEDGDVVTLEEAHPSGDRVLTESEADQVTHALRQVVSSGTGRAAGFGKAAAGKTGTTQDNKDAWFVGYVPKMTAAVWMGFPDPDGEDELVPVMDDVHGIEVTGGSFPAQIWNKFMRNATEGMDVGSFKAPGKFPGRVLNPSLVLTPDSTSSTSSTLPGDATSTSVDPNAPSSSSSSSSSTSTSTTQPPTTTTLPPCPPPPNDHDPPWPFCDPTP